MINTSEIIENILNSIITGIIAGLLPVFIPSIYSTIIGLNYKVSIVEVMFNIPIYIYLALSLPFIAWITRKYIKKKMNEGISLVGVLSYDDYEDIGHIIYNNLFWIVQVKSSSLKHAQYYGDINEYETLNEISKNIRIRSSPRCPKCKAELYFTQHDLWYTYDCVNPECTFKKRTWQSKDKMKDIAKKLYKYKFETEFKEK